MICPGVKRPPPMESELEMGLLLRGVRGVRGDRCGSGVFRGEGGPGPIVGPWSLASAPSKVAPESVLTASPHEEQNLPVAEIVAPHFAQNMGGGDSTTGYWLSATRLPSRLRNALHLDGRAVGQNFGDALHHFGGVVAHSDHRVGSVLACMLQQQFERIFARLLAKIRQNGDVSADNGLQRRAEISHHAPRAHDNSSYDAKVSHHPVAGHFHPGCNHSCIPSWHFSTLLKS